MKLKIHCAMCDEEKDIDVTVRVGKGVFGTIDADAAIKASGWITEQNGKNFDIYCSKRCAS